ncbi:MAG TPA: NfeD family protein [Actinotalea caeni]|nr:NfeD family protein [Actinotalea caeni]
MKEGPMGWLWWLGLALVLGVIELLTVDLTFLMLAGGAAAGGLAGALGAPFWLQIVIGVVVAVLLLVLVRPMAVDKLKRSTPEAVTNVRAHVGRPATVVADVTERAGRVKLAGEVWSARTESPGVVLATGTTVVVTRIEGATAVVAPQTQETPQQPYGQPGPGY